MESFVLMCFSPSERERTSWKRTTIQTLLWSVRQNVLSTAAKETREGGEGEGARERRPRAQGERREDHECARRREAERRPRRHQRLRRRPRRRPHRPRHQPRRHRWVSPQDKNCAKSCFQVSPGAWRPGGARRGGAPRPSRSPPPLLPLFTPSASHFVALPSTSPVQVRISLPPQGSS